MSDAPDPYRIESSDRFKAAVRKLIDQARASGRLDELLEALGRLNHLLTTYPQFGDPLLDLRLPGGRMCILTVPPLVVRYGILEDQRLVLLTIPPDPLPNSGLTSVTGDEA